MPKLSRDYKERLQSLFQQAPGVAGLPEYFSLAFRAKRDILVSNRACKEAD
jgi:hypothetical protein